MIFLTAPEFFYLWRTKIEKLRRLIFVLSFICIFPFSVLAQKLWTLEECASYAKENNISIKQAQLNEQLAEYTLTQSKLNTLPNLTASAGYYFNFGKTIDPTTNLFITQNQQTNTLQLSLGWPIFNGFQKINTIKENEFSLLASHANTANTAQTVLLYVAGGFLDIVYAKENLNNTDDQLRLSQQQLQRTTALVQAGNLAQGSLYDIEAQVATDELNKVTAQNQLDLAKLNLQQLLNLTEPLDVAVPEIAVSNELLQDLNRPIDSIYSTALKTQPSIMNARYNLLSSQKGLAVAKGTQYPTLSFFGSLSTNYSNVYSNPVFKGFTQEYDTIGFVASTFEPVLAPGVLYDFVKVPYGTQFKNNFGQAFGFSLDIPIFTNWNARTNINRAKIAVLNSEYNFQSAKLQLQKDVETAYQDAVAAKNSYEAALKGVTALQKAFDDAEKKFNLGAITSLDYTTAKRNLTKAQSDLLQSKYRYIFKLKVLDIYQGKPLTLQ